VRQQPERLSNVLRNGDLSFARDPHSYSYQ
jgi:hypothetical protein